MSGQDGERAPTSSPGQFALSRALATACADGELAHRCVNTALRSAGLTAMPEEMESLLQFALEHLEPVLAEELGPRMARTMMEDLEEEIHRVRRSTVRMARVALKRVPTPAMPKTVPPTPVPTVRSPAPRESLPVTRPVVALVDDDRWSRSSLARTLLQAGCDVLPLDSPRDLIESFVDAAPDTHVDVVVIDAREPRAPEAIAALLHALPRVRVVERSAPIEAILGAAGIHKR